MAAKTVAAKTAAANKAALVRAREAREKLDADRRALELRQDEATATALVGLGELAEIDAVREGKVAEVGQALRALMEQDVSAERAAGLLGLDAGEVRRLAKAAPPEPAAAVESTGDGKRPSGTKATVTTLPDQGESEDAARRAG